MTKNINKLICKSYNFSRYGAAEPILMAAFAPAHHGASSRALPRTAFCTYSLDYIDRLFDENLHMCFNGTMQQRNLPYISGTIQFGRRKYYCYQQNVK
jgi:hypothetical protein